MNILAYAVIAFGLVILINLVSWYLARPHRIRRGPRHRIIDLTGRRWSPPSTRRLPGAVDLTEEDNTTF